MELPDDLLALYSAELELDDGRPILSVPERELDVGDLVAGERYRIAVLPARSGASGASERGTRSPSRSRSRSSSGRARSHDGPPVEVGQTRDVEIEDVGDQGDGIARIGPGYVVFVPNTAVGDRVTVEITEARENFAFATVREGEPLSN